MQSSNTQDVPKVVVQTSSRRARIHTNTILPTTTTASNTKNAPGTPSKHRANSRNNRNHTTNRMATTSSNHSSCLALPKRLLQTWLWLWRGFTEGLRRAIASMTMVLATTAATYPVLTIGICILTSASLLAIGIQTNFRLEFDLVRMFTPETSRVHADRAWLETDAWTKFPPYTKTHAEVTVILHAHGDNVVTQPAVHHLFQALDTMTTTSGYDELCVSHNHTPLPQELQAAGISNDCAVYSVTRLWQHNATVYDQQVRTDRDVSMALARTTYSGNDTTTPTASVTDIDDDNDDDEVIDWNEILGRIEFQDGHPRSAQAMYLRLSIPLHRIGTAHKLFQYEQALQHNLAVLTAQWKNHDHPIRVEFASGANIADEFKQAIFVDLPLLPVVFLVMIGFTCAVFYKCHKVQSRATLGLGAVCTIVLSLAASFGLLFCIGIPYTVATNVIPYIVFGVGLDDTFIIVGSFHRTNPSHGIPQRIRQTFHECGLSIAMTTATTSLAFGLGCISTVPAIKMLCWYAFPALLIDYVYQVTCFVAILVLDERRVQAGRVDCCCCFPCITGGEGGGSSHRHDDDQDGYDSPRSSVPSVFDDERSSSSGSSKEGDKSHFTWYQQVGLRAMDWYSNQLLKPVVKAIILLFFGGLFAFCCWRTTKLEQKFSFFDLLPEFSHSKTYYEALKGYGGLVTEPSVLFRNVNQSDPIIQEQMIEYMDMLATIDGVVEKPFCWIRDAKGIHDDPEAYMAKMMQEPATAKIFQRNPQVQTFLNYTYLLDGMSFNDKIDAMLGNPVLRALYGANIHRNEQGDVILSRCYVEITGIDHESVPKQVEILKNIRRATDTQPINREMTDTPFFFTYEDMYHLWEFFAVAFEELKVTSVSSIVVVSSFAFLFMPHWSAILYIFPMMCVLYVDLLGLFQIAGLSINVLTYIIIVVSIGLLVDFVMHVLLRYFESQGKTREDKIRDMMATMGTSILLGGTSTFLGTLPLMFSQSLIFKTSFLAFVIMVLLGLSHGLILMPVLLSMFGTTAHMVHPMAIQSHDDILPDDHHDLEFNVSGTTNPDKGREGGHVSDTDSSNSSTSSDSEEADHDHVNKLAASHSFATTPSTISRTFSDRFGLKNLFILTNTNTFGGETVEAVTPASTVGPVEDSEFIEMTI